MRRLVLSPLAAACVILVMPAALTPSALGANALTRSDARARLITCRPALDPLARALTVDSVMRSLAAGDRMQMRFDLYQRRVGARRYRRLGGPGLGTWNSATPGVDRFRFRKPIQNLPAPATYFVKVSYRWLRGAGRIVARTTRNTATCLQPDLRPDLRVAGLAGVRPAAGNRFVYRVIVSNAGRSPAAPFDIVAKVGGGPQEPPVTVLTLAAGERRVVEVTGPRCVPGGPASMALDPDDRVDESNERNNELTLICP
jgi:CARDB